MEGRLTFTLSLRASRDGKLWIEVTPVFEDEHLTVRDTMLVLALWEESHGALRGSIHHLQSGTVAYIQGNQALADLAKVIDLSASDGDLRPAEVERDR